ncbi:MAG: hypothetical protein A3I05_05100 [Deltaproteobacteria bacterium RIFCSPLOWO2_02_FULL_44_10]|nr:MAG: hypothetical protein A3C46_05855 [Deltaproteobacteria bacterium RIFCSPHIGHO2_02_FULL_44_16]OGQ45970.1 MAG: hypothetical protein A3I05_05100 [Deltaproteobacteria bacterium RIFCSPLOWO2_02_FULL_44_10]
MMIHIPVSVGELLDKMTILEIKTERIADAKKRKNCQKEYDLLEHIAKTHGILFMAERAELKRVNEWLWEIEDSMRKKEAKKEFDQDFIELTRDEYRANDTRAKIKKEINLASGSELIEEKEYVAYDLNK